MSQIYLRIVGSAVFYNGTRRALDHKADLATRGKVKWRDFAKINVWVIGNLLHVTKKLGQVCRKTFFCIAGVE